MTENLKGKCWGIWEILSCIESIIFCNILGYKGIFFHFLIIFFLIYVFYLLLMGISANFLQKYNALTMIVLNSLLGFVPSILCLIITLLQDNILAAVFFFLLLPLGIMTLVNTIIVRIIQYNKQS